MRIRKINDEVYVADEPIVRVGAREIAFLKEKALLSARKRARICAHRSNVPTGHPVAGDPLAPDFVTAVARSATGIRYLQVRLLSP